MKKIIKKAFSLIELIIVVSIIAVISSSGIIYFTNFSDDLKIKNSVYEIKGDLDNLDNKISKREIFDYELYFEEDSLYYYNYENIFDLDYSQSFNNLDLNTGIGEIKINGVTSGTGVLKYYTDYKFQKEEEIDWDGTFTGNFIQDKNYKVQGSFSGQILNNINLNYFDTDRLIKLILIEDDIGISYPNIIIKNILGKKEFGNNPSINKIILTFENNIGKREILEISK